MTKRKNSPKKYFSNSYSLTIILAWVAALLWVTLYYLVQNATFAGTSNEALVSLYLLELTSGIVVACIIVAVGLNGVSLPSRKNIFNQDSLISLLTIGLSAFVVYLVTYVSAEIVGLVTHVSAYLPVGK